MADGERIDLTGIPEPVIASPVVPVVAEGLPQPAASVDLNELMDTRAKPEVVELLQQAALEGAQVETEGRRRW